MSYLVSTYVEERQKLLSKTVNSEGLTKTAESEPCEKLEQEFHYFYNRSVQKVTDRQII